MKATYLKPTTKVVLLTIGNIMITASGNGKKIVDNGGNTGDYNITEADSRRRQDVWDDEEEEDW